MARGADGVPDVPAHLFQSGIQAMANADTPHELFLVNQPIDGGRHQPLWQAGLVAVGLDSLQIRGGIVERSEIVPETRDALSLQLIERTSVALGIVEGRLDQRDNRSLLSLQENRTPRRVPKGDTRERAAVRRRGALAGKKCAPLSPADCRQEVNFAVRFHFL
jgi:hypothetical protein